MNSRVSLRTYGALKNILGDALYRGSLTLLANTAATAGIGFVFWGLAAHWYSPAAVGLFSSVTSGVGLLAAIATLGLQNTLTRHIASAEHSRGLMVAAIAAIASVGTLLCLVVVILAGPHLPASLHLQEHGRFLFVVTLLVILTAVSGTIDSGLIATRASHVLFMKNVLASIAKVGALVLLVFLHSLGLLIAYGVALLISTLLGVASLSRRVRGSPFSAESFRALRGYISTTSGNYLATIMGILPSSVVPLEVLLFHGAAQTARFAVAFLIAGTLNYIPSTVSQVLFAEASRKRLGLSRQVRKAVRAEYALLVPAVAVVVAAAPLALHPFGTGYVVAATGCLRVLGLSALFMGGTYLVDSLLIARDRIGAYIFINFANAMLVLGCVAVLLPLGLTAAAAGWGLGQLISLLLGLILLATGAQGRHHHGLDHYAAGSQHERVHSVGHHKVAEGLGTTYAIPPEREEYPMLPPPMNGPWDTIPMHIIEDWNE